MTLYDLLKSAHIIAVIVWLGGTMAAALMLRFGTAETIAGFRRFDQRATTPAMAIAWLFGLTMAVWQGWFSMVWLPFKLVFVVVLSGIHGMISGKLRRMDRMPEPHSPLRFAIPLMIACLCIIVPLAVSKPF